MPAALSGLPLSHTLYFYFYLQCRAAAAGDCLLLSIRLNTCLLKSNFLEDFMPAVLHLKQDLFSLCSTAEQGDLVARICRISVPWLRASSKQCVGLRGASHELSNEVLTITFLSRCCLWFYGEQETCMLNNRIWSWLCAESFACGSSRSNVFILKKEVKQRLCISALMGADWLSANGKKGRGRELAVIRGREGDCAKEVKSNVKSPETRESRKADHFTSTSRVRDGQSLKGYGRDRIGWHTGLTATGLVDRARMTRMEWRNFPNKEESCRSWPS